LIFLILYVILNNVKLIVDLPTKFKSISFYDEGIFGIFGPPPDYLDCV